VHELAIAESVIDEVARRTAGARVTEVHLEVGQLCGVVPDALRFCFDLAAEQTALEGCALVIEEPPGRAECRECGADFPLDKPLLLCSCGSSAVTVVCGDQLLVRAVRVV
jgi:hydrogenase nickel incorporation protein HypA/HybF